MNCLHTSNVYPIQCPNAMRLSAFVRGTAADSVPLGETSEPDLPDQPIPSIVA